MTIRPLERWSFLRGLDELFRQANRDAAEMQRLAVERAAWQEQAEARKGVDS